MNGQVIIRSDLTSLSLTFKSFRQLRLVCSSRYITSYIPYHLPIFKTTTTYVCCEKMWGWGNIPVHCTTIHFPPFLNRKLATLCCLPIYPPTKKRIRINKIQRSSHLRLFFRGKKQQEGVLEMGCVLQDCILSCKTVTLLHDTCKRVICLLLHTHTTNPTARRPLSIPPQESA